VPISPCIHAFFCVCLLMSVCIHIRVQCSACDTCTVRLIINLYNITPIIFQARKNSRWMMKKKGNNNNNNNNNNNLFWLFYYYSFVTVCLKNCMIIGNSKLIVCVIQQHRQTDRQAYTCMCLCVCVCVCKRLQSIMITSYDCPISHTHTHTV